MHVVKQSSWCTYVALKFLSNSAMKIGLRIVSIEFNPMPYSPTLNWGYAVNVLLSFELKQDVWIWHVFNFRPMLVKCSNTK